MKILRALSLRESFQSRQKENIEFLREKKTRTAEVVSNRPCVLNAVGKVEKWMRIELDEKFNLFSFFSE